MTPLKIIELLKHYQMVEWKRGMGNFAMCTDCDGVTRLCYFDE